MRTDENLLHVDRNKSTVKYLLSRYIFVPRLFYLTQSNIKYRSYYYNEYEVVTIMRCEQTLRFSHEMFSRQPNRHCLYKERSIWLVHVFENNVLF